MYIYKLKINHRGDTQLGNFMDLCKLLASAFYLAIHDKHHRISCVQISCGKVAGCRVFLKMQFDKLAIAISTIKDTPVYTIKRRL